MTPLLLRGQWGLGDNIFARPFIRASAKCFDLYLETPWPELYADLPVRFVRGERRLRTQMRNICAQPADRWSAPPRGIREVRIGYGHAELARGSIVQSLEQQFAAIGVRPELPWDLPAMGAPPVRSRRPIALVRPVTVRTEWRNEARNPCPEYIGEIAARLMATHHVVAIADLVPGHEWLAGPMPPAHRMYIAGELSVRQLLALARAADVIVGGVGWIVPAAIALNVKAFVVLGGHGGHNAPTKITDPRMDISTISFAVPRNFCLCTNMMHRCDNRIPDLSSQFVSWAERVGLRCSMPSLTAA